jgi:hypothetical protein
MKVELVRYLARLRTAPATPKYVPVVPALTKLDSLFLLPSISAMHLPAMPPRQPDVDVEVEVGVEVSVLVSYCHRAEWGWL